MNTNVYIVMKNFGWQNHQRITQYVIDAERKKQMTLYNVFYKGDSNGNSYSYQATTDNFEKWLEEHNARRIADEFEVENANEFKVEQIDLYLYNEEEH